MTNEETEEWEKPKASEQYTFTAPEAKSGFANRVSVSVTDIEGDEVVSVNININDSLKEIAWWESNVKFHPDIVVTFTNAH